MSVLPAKHNFRAWKGTTWTASVTYYSDEGTTAVNLTGFTVQMIFRLPNTPTPVLTLSTPGDIVVNSSGVITVKMTDEVNAGLTWNAANYELKVTNTAGDTDVILYGTFQIRG
jgi:hypothetical protein